jgi:hypothetical protein
METRTQYQDERNRARNVYIAASKELSRLRYELIIAKMKCADAKIDYDCARVDYRDSTGLPD